MNQRLSNSVFADELTMMWTAHVRMTVERRETKMETQPEIVFQGMDATLAVETAINEHVAQLEERYGRITACQIVLKAPSAHYRTSGLYEVHIHLSLPDGREVNVTRTPTADERHSDLTFAVDDAFKHARRQLQDQVRRVQGVVKQHEGTETGTVLRIDPSGDFGFLETRDGQEVYFHRNSVIDDGFAHLRAGSRVTYAQEMGDKGAQASTVRLMGKHGLRT
jgi:cold shock CspA family protein/ribosome-associated translation inhibitor RaiA